MKKKNKPKQEISKDTNLLKSEYNPEPIKLKEGQHYCDVAPKICSCPIGICEKFKGGIS